MILLHNNKSQTKRSLQDITAHNPPISSSSLDTLHTSGVLSNTNPSFLQRKVWFDITINFVRRKRENLRELNYDRFEFIVDDEDNGNAEMRYNEATKSHKGENLKDRDF